jgi:DUF4097 and DUF4098 domain-containing protein YvlB
MSSPAAPLVTRKRRSLAGPFVIIIVGVVFLLVNLGIWDKRSLLIVFARYWPVLIILWGLIKLLEYYQAQREGTRASGIGVGGVFLLAFLILAGFSASQAVRVNWGDMMDQVDWGDDMKPFFGGDIHRFDDHLQQAFPVSASLHVVSDRGGIIVNASDDNTIKVLAHKQVVADNDEQAKKFDSQTRPTISVAGDVVTVTANTTGGGQHSITTDLEIFLPRKVALDLAARRGDVEVHGRDGDVKISNSRGDVVLSDLGANSVLTLRKGSLTANHVHGNLTLDGRLDDTHISDVAGNVTLTGEFFGDISLNKIAKTTSFKSSRTDLEFSKLDGDLTIASGDLRGQSMTGPVRLLTTSKDIHLDSISGDLRLENKNGSVEVDASRLPLGNIRIANSKGDISLILPRNAAFSLQARTRDGEIQSEFEAVRVNSGDKESSATGSVGNNGPRLEINNEYGSIEIRKAG